MKKIVWALGIVMGLFLLGCGTGTDNVDNPPVVISADGASTPTVKAGTILVNDDFKLAIKEKSKDCYAYGIGCNLTYEVKVGVDKKKLEADDHSYELTYQVSGGKNGKQLGTVTVMPDGSYFQTDQFTETKSESTKLSVKLVSIERGV